MLLTAIINLATYSIKISSPVIKSFSPFFAPLLFAVPRAGKNLLLLDVYSDAKPPLLEMNYF